MNQIERLTMKIKKLATARPDLKPGFFLTESGYLGFNPGLRDSPQTRLASELKVGDILTSNSLGWCLHENHDTKFQITKIQINKINEFILSVQNMKTKSVYSMMSGELPIFFKDLS